MKKKQKEIDVEKLPKGNILRLESLFGSISVFSFVMLCVMIFLYIIGNMQDFLDETQTTLLYFIRITGFICGFAGIYYGVFTMIIIIKTRLRRFSKFIYAIIAGVLGFSMGISATFIDIILRPVV